MIMKSSPYFPLLKALSLFGVTTGLLWFTACSSDNGSATDSGTNSERATASAPATAVSDKGVGPITSVDVSGPVDQALAAEGKTVFEANCTACHKFEDRYVGPPMAGITKRRTPEWIMNMILNPQEMLEKDPTAQELLAEYMTQMPNQNITQEQARAILEYFRSVDNP
jgi:mono/diheme cytochrome c family protein